VATWARLWTWLLGFLPPEQVKQAEAWRARREALVKPSKPTYDGYPEHVPGEPEMRLYCEARDARGRLLREYVNLSGYSLHHINLRTRKWQEGLIDRIAEARYLLAVRISEEATKARAGLPPGERRASDRDSRSTRCYSPLSRSSRSSRSSSWDR
jgi:hypothetical protein